MTDHHVGSLRVHLKTHGSPPAELQAEARGFAESLLAAVADKLEARANGRLVRVRRLPVRLRARRELLADRTELERIADELARSISWSDAPAAWDEDVAIFDDEHAWRATYLAELARGHAVAWCFAELAAHADGIAGLSLAPAEVVAAVLARVDRHGQLAALLDTLSFGAVHALAVALDVAPAAAPSLLDAPSISRAPVHAAILARVRRTTAIATTPSSPAAPWLSSQPSDTPTAAAPTNITQFGGLAYVVRCLLELDVGETLWRACVPEQTVIASALAVLVDTIDDPGPLLLGGAPIGQRFDANPEQRAEIVAALCAVLRDALPRRGLAALPDVALVLDDGPHGRTFYALAGAGLPIFAAPAPTVAAASAAVQAFLATWRETTAIVATPSIAELVRDLRVSVDAARPRFGLRAELACDAALITTVTAGCAAALYEARAGALALARRARIDDRGEDRVVTMPLDAIDVDVRRAGLDRDPGWVPWLRRTVRIVFAE